MHTLLPIPEKINRVLTAGMLLWAAIWSLQGTALSQARGSSPRSASAAHVMLKSSEQKGVAGMFLDFIKNARSYRSLSDLQLCRTERFNTKLRNTN